MEWSMNGMVRERWLLAFNGLVREWWLLAFYGLVREWNGMVRGYSLTEWNGLWMEWSVNRMVRREKTTTKKWPFKIYNPGILFTDHSIHGPIHCPWRKKTTTKKYHLRSTIQAFYYFWRSNLALSLGNKLTAWMEPFLTFCTCKHEAVLWHATCTKYWNACNF